MRRGLVAGAVALVLGIIVVVVGLQLTRPHTSASSPVPTAASPTPIPIDQALLHRRVTFLLLGTDQNAQRQKSGESVLTDSMIVVSVNATHTRVGMLSVPRDTVDLPLPDGGTWPQKLNALYAAKGIDTLRGTFDNLLGVKIDYTVVINMDDFVSLIDAFGGVDVVVSEAIHDREIGLDITAGRHHLDGKTALAYSRSRYTTNDFARAERQHEVLVALLARFNSPSTKVDVPSLLKTLTSLASSIPADKLPTVLEIARRSRAAKVTDVVLQPPRFYDVDLSGPRGYVLLPKLDEIRAFAQPMLTGP
ncbi:MAG: LCP family protein [Chloroflexota bacterium]|nr:LCP family protein [Chloroflexota bacterium]